MESLCGSDCVLHKSMPSNYSFLTALALCPYSAFSFSALTALLDDFFFIPAAAFDIHLNLFHRFSSFPIGSPLGGEYAIWNPSQWGDFSEPQQKPLVWQHAQMRNFLCIAINGPVATLPTTPHLEFLVLSLLYSHCCSTNVRVLFSLQRWEGNAKLRQFSHKTTLSAICKG